MEQLHGVAERVNSLLDTVEGPIRAFVPQVTKTREGRGCHGRAAERPDRQGRPRVVPAGRRAGLAKLTALPTDLSEFMSVLSDLAHRLQPLGQMAESAGGLLACVRSLVARQHSPPPHPGDRDRRESRRPAGKETAGRRSRAAKKTAAKKASRPRKRPPRSADAAGSVFGDEGGRHDVARPSRCHARRLRPRCRSLCRVA